MSRPWRQLLWMQSFVDVHLYIYRYTTFLMINLWVLLWPIPMSPNRLPSQKILEGHTAAITVVGFSADGKFLASTTNNRVILVFSTSSWTPIYQFLNVSPVSVLVWHQKRRYILFCGHQSGDLHVLMMSKINGMSVTLCTQRLAYNGEIEMHYCQNLNVCGVYSLHFPFTNSILHCHCLWEQDHTDRYYSQPILLRG